MGLDCLLSWGNLTACGEGRKHANVITGSLQGDGQDNIVDVGSRVLAVAGVDERAEQEVDKGDECLCAEHTLPEIHGVSHLGEEGDEQEGTTVRVDQRVHSVEVGVDTILSLLVVVRGCLGKGLDGLNGLDQGGVGDDRVVDTAVSGSVHDDDEADDVEPDGSVGEPAETLQGANATQSHTADGEDEQADDEADALVGKLGDSSSVSENQHGDSHELLDSLGDVDEVAGVFAIDTVKWVTETHHWVAGRIKTEEDAPDQVTSNTSSETEDEGHANTETPSHVGKDITVRCQLAG